ncbi:hypothetical protein SpCBS45565_g04569 [Spizellomyces sp. 'palustris']|nr:hypothetical protein SpCBS45565_g04569 [Spizellomyces sp. 'palustris']
MAKQLLMVPPESTERDPASTYQVADNPASDEIVVLQDPPLAQRPARLDATPPQWRWSAPRPTTDSRRRDSARVSSPRVSLSRPVHESDGSGNSTGSGENRWSRRRLWKRLNTLLQLRRGHLGGDRYVVCDRNSWQHAPDLWRLKWRSAIAATILWWIAAYAALQYTLKDYSSFWPPNGVYVGCMILSSPYTRRLMPFWMALAIYTVNWVWKWPWYICLAFTIVNTVEALLVSLTTFTLASLLTEPGPIDLTKRAHMISFGIGCLTILITALGGGYMTMWLINPSFEYHAAYLRWLGRNFVGMALTVPLVVSIGRTTFDKINNFIRYQRSQFIQSVVLSVLVIACPAISMYFLDRSIFSAIVGLYLCYPWVLYMSALLGVFGAAFSTMLVALSAATTAVIFSKSHRDTDQIIPISQQLIWIQLFLSVLIFTALSFVAILAERDKAYQSVENRVKMRTAELTDALTKLDAAKGRAEGADRDKAVFLSFLCHELRNPLHAITNMAEFLLEDMGKEAAIKQHMGSTIPLSSQENSTRDVTGQSLEKVPLLHRGPEYKTEQRRPSHSSMRSMEDSQHRSAHAIKLSSEYMLALVNDVLDLGRFEAGRVSLENLVVDFWTLLEGNFSCSRQLARGHDVEFSCSISPEVPKWVETDPVRFQQIMNNLISNAYKFTPENGKIGVEVRCVTGWWAPKECQWGGVRFAKKASEEEGSDTLQEEVVIEILEAGDVNGKEERQLPPDPVDEKCQDVLPMVELRNGTLGTVSWAVPLESHGTDGSTVIMHHAPPKEWWAPQPDWYEWVLLEVSVWDTGIGMAPDVVATLFRPYAQAAVSTMREYGGSGLGLAITEQIVALMGGTVGVDTKPGKGSRFTVTLPIRVNGRPEDGLEVKVTPFGNMRRRRSWRPQKREVSTREERTASASPPTLQADSCAEPLPAVDIPVIKTPSLSDVAPGPVDQGVNNLLEPATTDEKKQGEPSNNQESHQIPPFAPIPHQQPVTDSSPTQTQPQNSIVPLNLTSPTDHPSTNSAAIITAPHVPICCPDYSGRQILIVDDSTINRRILLRMLQKMLPPDNLRIDQAENGKEAVDLVKRSKVTGKADWYHIIFMDIVMPIMDGYEATRTIRDLGCGTPVVITTANQVVGNAEAEEQLREVGADEAVGKPFTKDVIIAVLKRWDLM